MNTKSKELNGLPDLDLEYRLDLIVADRDVVEELHKRPASEDRNCFALAALRVGVLTIRQAFGVIDGRAIQQTTTARRSLGSAARCWVSSTN